MTTRARFRQVDVKRAVEGAVAAGMQLAQLKVVIDPLGNIIIMSHAGITAPAANPWDELLTP